tara:strand:- start:80 stop:391 length:312 start_codon:yes stop_codon:yes gene_type:complete
MAQEKNKEYNMPLGSDGGNPTPNPDFVAEVERQKDLQNMPLGSDGGNPTPNPEFQKEMQQQQSEVDSLIKRAAEVEIGKNFSIWDITTDLGLQFNPFKKEDKQ